MRKTIISRKTILFFTLSLLFTPLAFSKLYINEISGNEKWLEVYNDGDTDVDMKGYFIRKINEKGEKDDSFYIIPGNVVPAGGYKSWQRDKNCTDGSTFKWGISAKKDVAFTIIDTEGKEVDHFEIKEDLYSEGFNRTVGRETDGADKLVIFTTGTRNASNSGGTIQVPTENPKKIYINEINGNKINKAGEDDQPKWLEIYNGEKEEVDISNYTIQKIDEKGNIDNWFIPVQTTIAAEGFLVWEQDSLCENGSTFTWGISARKNVSFKLFDPNGTMIDYFVVDIEAEAARLLSEGEGKTVGREYDGDEKLVVFPGDGTKNASNGKKTIPNSTNDVSATTELRAYFNGGIIYVSEDVKAVTLISTTGKTVLQQAPLNSLQIPADHLPSGIYILKMQGENNKSKAQKLYIK